MSLFTTLSDMSKQHAENSGSYTFEKPAEPEPAPTVSLYNLLDHSREDLYRLSVAVRDQIRSIEDIKLTLADTYTSLCAWKTLIDSAIIEKQQRDSEAWAEKTAKEITKDAFGFLSDAEINETL